MGFDLGIDHNIKKQWIPFLLDNSSPDTTSVFTFRSHDASGPELNSDLRIRICPSQDIIKKMIDGESGGCDIAHRLLFSQDSDDPKLGFDTIL